MLLKKKEVWLPVLALMILGGFIYAFNLFNGLFWDDEDWIVNNIFVHKISWSNIKFWFTHNTLAGIGLKSNYYRPFLFFTFAFNYMLAGVKPLVYHLTSNAIHIFNALLIFSLIWLAFKRKLLAFLVALFFLIHPLQTEAVTYISGRGDMLVAMFMLLALILFYKVNRPEARGNHVSVKVKSLVLTFSINKILSLVFLVLGLLSRETGIIFPLLALVFYMAVLSPGQKFLGALKNGLIKTWPYFGVVLIYGILRLTALNFLNTLNFYAEPNIYSEHLSVRFFTFLPILGQYLKLLIAPVGLHMERGATVYISFFQWPVWLVGLTLVGLLVWLKYLYRVKQNELNAHISTEKQSRGWDVWFFGIFWFFFALALVSGITPINALLYEHWLYLPMVGFWLIVSFYLVKIFDQSYGINFSKAEGNGFVRGPSNKTLFLGAFKVIISIFLISYFGFLAYQSIQRNILWGKPVEFYKDILKYEPQSARISNNLGNLYFNQGDKEQAEEYYRQSVEAGDDFPQAYFNLGSILQSKGDIFGAIQLYEQAVQINPNFYYPYQNLAVIYAQQGKLDKAKDNIEKLKSLLPNNPRVFYNSALIYLALKDKAQALIDLKEGIKLVSSDTETKKLIEELIKKLNK